MATKSFLFTGLVSASVAAIGLQIDDTVKTGWTAPVAPPPIDGWDGDPAQQLLTVAMNPYMVQEATRFAPCALEIDVTVLGAAVERPLEFTAYDPTYDGLIYVTVTGESEQAVGRNTRIGDPAHSTKAYRGGQAMRHFYSEPGEYTAVTYVYERGGKWGKSAPFTFTILPRSAIPAARTVVLSNAAEPDWDSAPAHDVANRVTTIDAAIARVGTIKPSAGMWRLSVDNSTGLTYDTLVNDPLSGSPLGFSFSRWLFDTWDPAGERAVIDPAFHVGVGVGAPGTIDNLRLVYSWDRETAGVKPGRTGFPLNPQGNIFSGDVNEPAVHHLYHNTDIEDTFGALAYGADPVERLMVMFANCRLADMGDYISLGCRSIAFINSFIDVTYGVDLGQMGRHRMGGMNDRFAQAHNSIRSPERGFYIDGSFMQARGGWSGQNNGNTLWDTQALIRSQATQLAPGQKNYIGRSVMLGDIQIGTDGSQTLIENTVILNDPAVRNHPQLTITGGHSLRNVVFMFIGNPDGSDWLDGKNISKFESATPEVMTFDRFMNVVEVPTTAQRTLEILHVTSIVYKNPDNRPGAWNLFTGSLPSGGLVSGHHMAYAPDHGTVPTGGVALLDQPWTVLDVWMRVGWERQTFTLPADVADGATTPLIPYPNDWNNVATVQADYAGTRDRHSVRLGGPGSDQYHQLPGAIVEMDDACTFNFEANGFTILNRSGTTWPSGTGLQIMLDRGTTLEDPTPIYSVVPSRVRLARPVQAQPLTPGVPSTLFDFSMRLDRLRPGAGYAISPTTGVNSAGAQLPV